MFSAYKVYWALIPCTFIVLCWLATPGADPILLYFYLATAVLILCYPWYFYFMLGKLVKRGRITKTYRITCYPDHHPYSVDG